MHVFDQVDFLEWARQRKVPLHYGEVLRDNHLMVDFCRELGFCRRTSKDDPQLVVVELDTRIAKLE